MQKIDRLWVSCPTVSFPVPGTTMIEPTESENSEIDRFCDIISIKSEILSCKKEESSNVLTNSPHTLEMITTDNWIMSM